MDQFLTICIVQSDTKTSVSEQITLIELRSSFTAQSTWCGIIQSSSSNKGFRSLRFIRTSSFVSTGNSSLDVITSLVSIFFAVSYSIKVNEIISIRFSFVVEHRNLLLWNWCSDCEFGVPSICSNSFQLCIRFYTVFEITIKCKVYIQGGAWSLGGGGGQGAMATLSNFWTKQSPTVSVSNRGNAFYGCSESLQTKNFINFTMYMLQYFDKWWQLFIFSNYKREINHFKLDFLKRSDT